MQKPPIKLNCPTCETKVIWSEENEYRPFCSRRCQLIDFGDWAYERNSIPGEPVILDEEDVYDDKLL